MRRSIVTAVCFVTLVVGLAAAAAAQEHPACSNARLAGVWGYTETGTVVTPLGAIPAAAVGRYAFDEEGNFSGAQYSSANGGISHDTKQGTYTLNPDCTGTLEVSIYNQSGMLTRKSVWSFVLVEKGAEMRALLASTAFPSGTPPLAPIMTMNARKVFLGDGPGCSVARLEGEWGYTKTGTLLLPSGPVPYAAVGKFIFDASGTVSGFQESSTGGAVLKNQLKGSFSIDADCRGIATAGVYDESGNTWLRTAVMSLVVDDNQREGRGIVTLLTVPNPAGGTMNLPQVITVNAKKLSANAGNGQ